MLTFGLEVETYGRNKELVNRALIDNGIKGCIVKPDGTPNVDCEIVLPPLAPCDFAFDYIKKVCRVLEDIGCRINRQCGLHVHISNAQTLHANPTNLSASSIQHTEATGRFIGGSDYYADPMDAVAVKDIMTRYAKSQSTINSMFPRSRTNNRYCSTMNLDRLNSARTIEQLRDATTGKFSVINLNHWRNGTIEFRQASGTIDATKIINWVMFLINLVEHTINNRIETGQNSETISTPDQLFRSGSRIGLIYSMCRSTGGCDVHDLMNATGTTAINIRARVSEIRARLSDGAVVTHTMQANGNSYGDGQDLARYEILSEYQTQSTGARLLPDNRLGLASVWSGLSDELFEWWQNRIVELSRS
jgi:hypothetical protein